MLSDCLVSWEAIRVIVVDKQQKRDAKDRRHIRSENSESDAKDRERQNREIEMNVERKEGEERERETCF